MFRLLQKIIFIILNSVLLCFVFWIILEYGWPEENEIKDKFLCLLLIITPLFNLSVILETKIRKTILKILLSKVKLRTVSGTLFVLGGIAGYFSRREGVIVSPEWCARRAIFPPECSYLPVIYYLKELIVIAVLLFVAALVLFVISFKIIKR